MNTYNPYAPNPYIQQMQQPQELGGLQPAFQNTSAQQASQNAAMQQGAALSQQAGQVGQSGGMNPMAMAMMLRKGKPDQAAVNAKDAQMGGLGTYNPLTQYDISQKYGTNPYSQSSRMLAAQESGMGFNSSPVNNMPVVGAYGQLLPNN
jgi:hypothetical protein